MTTPQRIDPAEVLAAWPDDDAVRQAPELAVEQIHELTAAVVEARKAAWDEGRDAGAAYGYEVGANGGVGNWDTRYPPNPYRADAQGSTPSCTCNAADLATYAGQDATCAVHGEPDIREGSTPPPALECPHADAYACGRDGGKHGHCFDCDARIDHPAPDTAGPTHEHVSQPDPPGMEVGTVIGIDLDGVRDGHVPWPGDSDDGTCSCCGMPHPCVTRRLVDALKTTQARIDRARALCVYDYGPCAEFSDRILAVLDGAPETPAAGVNADTSPAMDAHDGPHPSPGPGAPSAGSGTTP